MPTVADVLRRYGPAYLERFGAKMPAEHKKVLDAIAACQTGQLGIVIYECPSCGTTHAMGRSCGNRHCPTCQQNKAKAWLENQIDRLLPCPYFLLTFTVPAGLRGSCADTSASPMPPCSRRPAPRSKLWPPTPNTSARPGAVSSASSRPGAAHSSIILMFITSSRAAESAQTARDGSPPR